MSIWDGWDEMKSEILEVYPKAPALLRIIAPFLEKQKYSISRQISDNAEARQSAVLVKYKGKMFTYRFGEVL